MYSIEIIKSDEILKSDKKNAIKKWVNQNNKYWNQKDKFEDLINRLNKRKYSVYFILCFNNKKVVGGFRYYKTTIKNKILLNRFMYKNGTYLCVQEVFVIDEYRGKGILDKLFFYFFSKIRKNNKVILAVDKTNKYAIKAYERNGFSKLIERKVTNKLLDNNKYTEIFQEYLMMKI